MVYIKKFDELSVNELYNLLALRAEVFVVEQECPYNDLDYKDKVAIHIYKVIDEKIVSCIRILPEKVSYMNPSIGRVVTLGKYRGRGYSKELLEKGIEYIFDNFEGEAIEISAQLYLLDFYRSMGFEPEGDTYLEDNIPHIHMILKNK